MEPRAAGEWSGQTRLGKQAPAYDLLEKSGTSGRTRTATGFTPGDFESPVSTNFTTLASERLRIILTHTVKSTQCRSFVVYPAGPRYRDIRTEAGFPGRPPETPYNRSNSDSRDTWANEAWAASSTKLWKLSVLMASA